MKKKLFLLFLLFLLSDIQLYSQNRNINWQSISLYVLPFEINSYDKSELAKKLNCDTNYIDNRLSYCREQFIACLNNSRKIKNVIKSTDREIENYIYQFRREQNLSDKKLTQAKSADGYITIRVNYTQTRVEFNAQINDFSRGYLGLMKSINFHAYRLDDNSEIQSFMCALNNLIIPEKTNNENEFKDFWNNLSLAWKNYFISVFNLKTEPTVLQIKNILNLDTINIGFNSQISDLKPISRLHKLKKINCVMTNIESLEPLKKLKYLEYIDVSWCRGINDIYTISDLPNLKYLDCSITGISDINGLYKMKTLQELYISDTDVSDLSPLQNCTNLEVLRCFATKITNIKPLRKLNKLQKFHLEGLNIIDFSPLSKLSELTDLDISNTQFNNLQIIKNLTKLQFIDISNTEVNSLLPLKRMVYLRALDCSNTKINSLIGLENCVLLQSISFFNTAVISLRPLNNCYELSAIGYNSKIPIQEIDEFKKTHPKAFESKIIRVINGG